MGHCRTRQCLEGDWHDTLFLVTGTATPGEARRLRRLSDPMLGGEGDAGTTRGGTTPNRDDSGDSEKAHLRVQHWTQDTQGDVVRFRLPAGTLNKDSLRGAALPFAVVKESHVGMQ